MSPPYSDELLSVLAAAASTSTADRALKARQQALYVKQLWFTLTGVIALLTLIRFSRLAISYMARHATVAPAQISTEKGATAGKLTQTMSVRRLPSALTTAFRIAAFRWTLWVGPGAVMSISEFTFIAAYISLAMMWTFINTRNLTIMFWEDRAAHIASCQVPLIVALAGKNSIISWLTGVSHEKLNVLHRAAGRTALILLWCHALQRYAAGLPAKWAVANAGWMQSGVLGLAAFSLAALLAVRPIRNRLYEFFLVTHIVLITLFIVGGYMHAKQVHFGDYLWPALVVWGFDRTLRIGRLLWNTGSSASIELLGSDTVRITMKRNISWRAGQHAYLIMPAVSNLPSEAHPFTIASAPHSLEDAKSPKQKDVVFLVRGRSGFTQRLRHQANTFGQKQVTVLLDGPYGCPPNLNEFTTCVLFAGGSGVSYTLPLLMDLVYQAKFGKTQCKRIVFVWAVRDIAHIKWISVELQKALAAAPPSLVISARLFITGAVGAPSLTSSSFDEVATPHSFSDSEKKLDVIKDFDGTKTEYGRPDVYGILEEEITTCPGTVSVDVAGPHGLATAVRQGLSSELAGPVGVLRGRAPVVLHVETFGLVKH